MRSVRKVGTKFRAVIILVSVTAARHPVKVLGLGSNPRLGASCVSTKHYVSLQ